MSTPTPPAAPARLVVDLRALADNWRTLDSLSPGAETGAAVKADAYGTGAEAAGPALAAAGCRTFFVALPAEGAALRGVLPDADIYVLNGFHAPSAALYAKHRLAPVLGDTGEIDAWLGAGTGSAPPAIHVDTGMNRLGLSLEDARALSQDHVRLPAIRPSLVMSHLACADRSGHPLNALQIQRFAEVRAWFPGVRASLSNSAGIALGGPARFDLVRPGISLYGGTAVEGGAIPVRPVVRVEADVLTVRSVPAGEGVGYGAAATTGRPSLVAIVSAGYADGIQRRLAAAGAMAAIGGRRVPYLGRVSMDLLALDVTDLGPGAVRRGDAVELVGPDVPLSEVATLAGTIDYEILTGLSNRMLRQYIR